MKTSLLLLALALPASRVAAQPVIPILDWEKRSNWVDVKTDVAPAAVGDGAADDTAAIQKALDGVRDGSTVYLPPGTYRVTDTLALKGPARGGVFTGVLVVGHGRRTRLVWDGKQGGAMLSENCLSHGRLVGMVLDGRNKAAVGICHYRRCFGTEVDHQHLALLNFTDAGVFVDPKAPYALAETVFANCLFENCRRGVVFPKFNDYDYTFDGCEFRRCETGILCVHGNAYVRNCHFEASREADMAIHAEHGSSVRRCTSVRLEDVPDLRRFGGAADRAGLPCRGMDRPRRGSPARRRAGDGIRLRVHQAAREEPARQALWRPDRRFRERLPGDGGGLRTRLGSGLRGARRATQGGRRLGPPELP